MAAHDLFRRGLGAFVFIRCVCCFVSAWRVLRLGFLTGFFFRLLLFSNSRCRFSYWKLVLAMNHLWVVGKERGRYGTIMTQLGTMHLN
ncbi:hypothetical protein LP420_26615 [Massilia sp. B-10]|nr:hypothetical protein LP420_26615 [Massilia sp. B-10]